MVTCFHSLSLSLTLSLAGLLPAFAHPLSLSQTETAFSHHPIFLSLPRLHHCSFKAGREEREEMEAEIDKERQHFQSHDSWVMYSGREREREREL